MANKYWVGGTGTWSDRSHWATSSGGAGGAGAPTTSDDCFIDNNSFTTTGTITISATTTIRSLDASGLTKNATVQQNGVLVIYSSFLLPENLTWNADTIGFYLRGDGDIRLGGNRLGAVRFGTSVAASGRYTLLDEFRCYNAWIAYGSLCSNEHKIIVENSVERVGASGDFILDCADIECTTLNIVNYTGLTVNSARIKTSAVLTSNVSWDVLEITGANASFNTNGDTYNQLIFTRGGKTTFSGGKIYVKDVISTGTTGTAEIVNANFEKAGDGIVNTDYFKISNSTAIPTGIWYVGRNSIDGGSNTGFIFKAPMKPSPAMYSPITSVENFDVVSVGGGENSSVNIPHVLRSTGVAKDSITIDNVNKIAELVRNVGVVELDGTEDWSQYTAGSSTGVFHADVFTNSVAMYGSSVCTHFTNKQQSWTTDADYGYFSEHVNVASRRYFNTGGTITTVENWKTWLAEQKSKGTPVVVYYTLESPVSENITYQKIKTFYPSTDITTTASVDPNMNAKIRIIENL